MKRLKRNLIAFVFTLLMCLPILVPAHLSAQTKAWKDISRDCLAGPDADVATIVGIECVVANLLNIGVTIVAIASFIMLIIGSMFYLASGGNPKATETGSKTITYAIRGIIVSISGWIVINFVATFTGVGDAIKIFRVTVPSPTP